MTTFALFPSDHASAVATDSNLHIVNSDIDPTPLVEAVRNLAIKLRHAGDALVNAETSQREAEYGAATDATAVSTAQQRAANAATVAEAHPSNTTFAADRDRTAASLAKAIERANETSATADAAVKAAEQARAAVADIEAELTRTTANRDRALAQGPHGIVARAFGLQVERMLDWHCLDLANMQPAVIETRTGPRGEGWPRVLHAGA